METAHWALLVAVIAITISVGVPIWQHFVRKTESTDAKRTLLIQRILEARSIVFVSMNDLKDLISFIWRTSWRI